MKSPIILLTSFGLLVVPVLAADTLLPLVDAHLDTSHHEVVTSHESRILAVGNSYIDAPFDAFAPTAISTPTQTVIPTPTDTTEPKPTSSVTLVPESTDVPSSTSLPISTSTPVAIPITRGMATTAPRPTSITIRESTTALIEMPSVMPTQATWAATVTWATWTATVTGTATGTATSTAPVLLMPSPLLDRLVANKPSIWGHRAFYIILGLLYVILLGMFLRWTINIPRSPS